MYSQETMEYFKTLEGYELLVNPTHSSVIGNPLVGHYFSLGVELVQELIVEVSIVCPRCIPAMACGSYLYKTLKGKNIHTQVSVEDIMTALGGLPPQRAFYAWMAAESLRQIQLQVLGKDLRI